ncbi:uncharacterized protein [Amphiura filiformis]|uniref:uncharacterized protein n=1 Tax=Amphiura filiformis TaxID=82378 RepID=UPI003B2100D9
MTKMNGRTLFTLLLVILVRSHFSICQILGVTVNIEVTNPDEIKEGSDIHFTCRVTGSFEVSTDTVQFLRQTNEELNPTVLVTEMGLSFPQSNVQFNGWQTNNGVAVLTVSLLNVTRSESVDYTCQAFRPHSSGGFINLGSKTLRLDVQYPPSGQPSCKASPPSANFTWNSGDDIQFTCTSDSGNSEVTLQWISTGMMSLPEAETQVFVQDGGSLIVIGSLFTITIDPSFNGVSLICSRQNEQFPERDESCMIGPFTVLGTNVPMLTPSLSPQGIQTGVIAGSASAAVLLIILIIVFILLVRSGRCKCVHKTDRVNKTDETLTSDDVPMAVATNNKNTLKDEGHDNPVPVTHILSPNGGEEYAVIQKRKSEDASASNGKKYPAPPNYPRPPKERKESVDEGEQYANTGIATLSGSTSDLLKEINVIKNSSDDDHLDIQAYANTADVTPTLQRNSEPSQIQSVDGDGEKMMYANMSEIGSRPKSEPVIVTRMPTDDDNFAPMYVNTANTIDETSPDQNYKDEDGVPLYATAKNVSGDTSHLPEPTESPPPPPPEEAALQKVFNTPGLDYADLDLNNQNSSVGKNIDGKNQNRESVVYASVS